MDFAYAFNTMTLVDSTDKQWHMDSGATCHLSNMADNLKYVFNNGIGKNVIVANSGKTLLNSVRSFFFKHTLALFP